MVENVGIDNKVKVCPENVGFTNLAVFGDETGTFVNTTRDLCIEHVYDTPGEKTVYLYHNKIDTYESSSITLYVASTISDVVIGESQGSLILSVEISSETLVNATFIGSDATITILNNSTGDAIKTKTPIESGVGFTLKGDELGEIALSITIENGISMITTYAVLGVEELIEVEAILPKGQAFENDIYVAINEAFEFTFKKGSNVLMAWMVLDQRILVEQCTGVMEAKYTSIFLMDTIGDFSLNLIISNSISTVEFNAMVHVIHRINNISELPYTHLLLGETTAIGFQKGTEALLPMGTIQVVWSNDALENPFTEWDCSLHSVKEVQTTAKNIPTENNYTVELSTEIDTMLRSFFVLTEPDLDTISFSLKHHPDEVDLSDGMIPIDISVTMDPTWSFTIVCAFTFTGASDFEKEMSITNGITQMEVLLQSTIPGDVSAVANCSNKGFTSSKVVEFSFIVSSNCFDSSDIFDPLHREKNNPTKALVTATTAVSIDISVFAKSRTRLMSYNSTIFAVNSLTKNKITDTSQ